MKKKEAKSTRLLLTIIAVASIALGFLKIYTHYNSIFRVGPIDYIVAIGAIVGGVLVITQKVSDVISVICISFLTFEVFKAIIDFHDFNDVFLCIIAIICLIIPLFRYNQTKSP